MIRFCILGALDLRRSDGDDLSAVLAHPKRVALLVYLAAAAPHGFHRRDTLLALFWPELDQAHARGALRQALRFLRGGLGDGVLVTRGTEEVGLAAEGLWCDVVDFVEALEAGDWERAHTLYRGDLLTGFHLSGCAEFERWLDAERERLRERAAGVVWTLAIGSAGRAATIEAYRYAERALALGVTPEAHLRQLLQLLDRAGDRQGAIRLYDQFVRRSRDEYDLAPSQETLRLVAEIRSAGPPPLGGRLSGDVGGFRTERRDAAATQATRAPVNDFARRLHQEYELEPSAETRRLVADIRDDGAVPPQPVPPSSDIGVDAGGAPTTRGPPVLRRSAATRLRAPVAVLGLAALAAGALLTGQWLARDDPRQADSREGSVKEAGPARDHPDGDQLYREALAQVERWRNVAGNRERARLAPIIVSLLQEAIARDSTFVEAYVELAIQHLRISWFAIDKSGTPVQQAWAALAKAMRLRPDAPEVHRALGYYYLWAERDYARAAQEFTSVLRHRPDDGEMLFALGGALRRQGKLEEAVRRFERALVLNRSALFTHSTLCETYLGMRRYAEAERCLLTLVEKGPDRPYSHAYLMRLYVLWRGDLTRVRAVLEAAGRSIAPAELPENWADLYLFERNYAAALDHLDPLLAAAVDSGVGLSGQADPYSVRAQLLAAWLYAQLGRPDEARAMYARVATKIERAPSAPQQQGGRHTWLAIAYAGLGRHEDAVQEALTAERLFRSANDLWGWPIGLEIVTQAYVMAGAYDRALDRIEELLSLRYYLALSPAQLRVDPRWDPLRQHPRFRNLLAAR